MIILLHQISITTSSLNFDYEYQLLDSQSPSSFTSCKGAPFNKMNIFVVTASFPQKVFHTTSILSNTFTGVKIWHMCLTQPQKLAYEGRIAQVHKRRAPVHSPTNVELLLTLTPPFTSRPNWGVDHESKGG